VAVDRANPADYDAALAAAQHEKSVQDQEQYHTTGHMPGLKTNLGGEPMDIGALTLEEQEAPGDINAVTPQTQCYNCKGYGHMQAKCWKPKRAADISEVHALPAKAKPTGNGNKRVAYIIRNRNAAPRKDPRKQGDQRGGGSGERKQYVRRFLNEICELLDDEDEDEDHEEDDPGPEDQPKDESGDDQPDF
jgi:hypothetical protein